MRICMVTPHIPPYQSANAILPQILAEKLKNDGNEVSFIVPRSALDYSSGNGDYMLTAFDMSRSDTGLKRKLKIDVAGIFAKTYLQCRKLLKNVDVVHLHSNGLLHQIVAITAERMNIPQILTHYGTEIWHYKPKKVKTLDPFLYLNKVADSVTYYSEKLKEFSFEHEIKPDNPVTVYPPAGDEFKPHSEKERLKLRKELGLKGEKILVNVKRLHPLGGHEYLIKAMPDVIKAHPDVHLYICGDGDLRNSLQSLAKKLKVDKNITFAGMVSNTEIWKYYAAADLYVLSSVLEALPTVAVEALACATPVVITDTPGGVELSGLFKKDLEIVEMKNPPDLAEAIIHKLERTGRADESTLKVVDDLFRIDSVYRNYLEIYNDALDRK